MHTFGIEIEKVRATRKRDLTGKNVMIHKTHTNVVMKEM